VHAVRDGLGDGVALGDFDQHRRLEHPVGEFLDFVREGRREEQALALLGQQTDDAGDVRDEAHVQHAVGFVQDERLHAAEIEALLFDQVEQASRRCHEHFDASADFFDLRLDVDAAISAQAADRDVLAVGLDRFVYLDGQFARRRQHQNRAPDGGLATGLGWQRVGCAAAAAT
jgi:hypothetical protein